MREILFKAKRLDNGEWVEGYPFPNIGRKELTRMAVFDESDTGIVVNTYSVDPETVCQFTGIETLEGKKVFESDIVSDGYYKGVVKYGNYAFYALNGVYGYYFSNLDDDRYSSVKIMYILNGKCDLEILGNIHDKEELNNEN